MDTSTQLQALVPVVSPLITLGIKVLVEKYSSKVPRAVWPLVCGVAGVLADYLATLATGSQWSPAVGFGLGLAGVGLREVVKSRPPKDTVEEAKVDIKP
jgi:hypothetical protein